MTESPVGRLEGDELAAAREALVPRIAAGDVNALDEFFALRGVRMVPDGPIEVTPPPATGPATG